ncbi:MAG TPA: condensation domain-containing protein, partial [Longimicrobium sp.]|nr:condensation domain-containing protein [Longimicrobium sp.]
VVQGAWALLLARWTGRDDVVHGTVVSGRPPALAGVEETVGLFVNTLPVRVAVPADVPVGAWLQAVQDRHLALRQHEHAPLPSVQAWSGAKDRTLFETLFAFENYPVQPGAEGVGVELAGLRAVEQTNYPLTVAARAGEGVRLKAMYDRARLSDAEAARVLDAFRTLLETLAAAPDATLAELPRLGIEPAAGSAFPVETASTAEETLAAPAPVAPRTPTEARIAGMWREVLRVEEVGVEDNFFDAGGDSLLGMRMISRIRSGFGVDLQMRVLADAPTVAGMAAHVDALLSTEAAKAAAAPEDAGLDDLLDQLGMLSEEELERMLLDSAHEEAGADD